MRSPIVSSAQMRAVEEAAFAHGVEVETLMDKAGAGIARTVQQFFPIPGSCIVYPGKGHNGGDALVAGGHLKRNGWDVDVRPAFPESDCSELTQKNLRAVRETQRPNTVTRASPARIGRDGNPSPMVILDGLLGLGAKPVLREPVRSAAREINQQRTNDNAFVFAVDVPTGLDADTGETDPEDCVVADFTVSIGFAKHGLVADAALDFVGRIEVVPLSDLVIGQSAANEVLATRGSLGPVLPRRKFSAYKNQFGRVGIVAGSEGFLGAAILATEGALRAGAGLVNLFVPRDLYALVAATTPDEAMVKPIRNYKDLLDQDVDVWAVGPGLGRERATEMLKFIDATEQPMVLDADALNALSTKVDLLKRPPGPRLLTPHPGEMQRLMDAGKMSRAGTARHFCDLFPVTLLFKGSRSIICERERPLSYNSTGNPGMASGGMGDVLTGVCAGLAGRKLALYEAARVGAWVCGRAAEMAIFNGGASEESLLPRDVIAHLGRAFNDLRDRLI